MGLSCSRHLPSPVTSRLSGWGMHLTSLSSFGPTASQASSNDVLNAHSTSLLMRSFALPLAR